MRAKASPVSIGDLVQGFLLQKQVNGCSARTVQVYGFWIDRLAAVVPDTAALDSMALTRFFSALRDRGVSASTIHQAFPPHHLRKFQALGAGEGTPAEPSGDSVPCDHHG